MDGGADPTKSPDSYCMSHIYDSSTCSSILGFIIDVSAINSVIVMKHCKDSGSAMRLTIPFRLFVEFY